MTVARAARYQHLVKEAAEQLDCGVDSELARHVGILRLARETFAERLITGKEVNPADLVRLDDCLRQYLPLRAEPSEPLAVVVDRHARDKTRSSARRETLRSRLPAVFESCQSQAAIAATTVAIDYIALVELRNRSLFGAALGKSLGRPRTFLAGFSRFLVTSVY